MPNTQPTSTPTIMFDHIENVAKLMSPDDALRKLAEPLNQLTTVVATSGIPAQA
jgi:hypothetical protein